MYGIKKVDKDSINKMRNRYYDTVTAPMDDMWEQGIIRGGVFYAIKKNKTIGYFAVDSSNNIIQFYIEESYRDESIAAFDFVLKQQYISQAFVCTYEPQFLSLCMDRNAGVKINSYLYTQIKSVDFDKPIKSIYSKLAKPEDLEAVLTYNKDKVGLDGDWQTEYYKKLIPNEELMLYFADDEIIGAGEMRPSKSSNKYANIGMSVSKDYRRKKIGTYILTQMRAYANSRELTAICSTTAENIASQRAIIKCGFYAYHRILTVRFK